MRTTLKIDDDILAAARSMAESRSISIGAAISNLARAGLKREGGKFHLERSRIPVFKVKPNAKTITLEDIKRLEDE